MMLPVPSSTTPDPAPVSPARSSGRPWLRSPMSSHARALFGVAFGLLCLALALRGVDAVQVGRLLAAVDLPLLALGQVLVLAVVGVKALRWQRLYPAADRPPLARLARALFVGMLWNSGIPARPGELARVQLAGDGRRAYTAGTLVVEKLADLALLAALAAALAWSLPLGAAPALGVLLALALAAVAVAAMLVGAWLVDSRFVGSRFVGSSPCPRRLPYLTSIAGSVRLLRRLPYLARVSDSVPILRWLPSLDRVAGGIAAARASLAVAASPTAFVSLVGLSALALALGALANYCALVALGADLPLAAPLSLLVVGYLGGALPSTPGRVGVFQYLCVVALAPFGAAPDLALGYGILMYCVTILVPALLALVLLLPSVPFAARLAFRRTFHSPARQSPSADSCTQQYPATGLLTRHSSPADSLILQTKSSDSPTHHARSTDSLAQRSPPTDSLTGQSPSNGLLTRPSPSTESLTRPSPPTDPLTRLARSTDSPSRRSRAADSLTGEPPSTDSFTRRSKAAGALTRQCRSTDPLTRDSPSVDSLARQARATPGFPAADSSPATAPSMTSAPSLTSVAHPRTSSSSNPVRKPEARR
ncbi:MAG: flippase-like domain-containing protein [Chloroflexi bacterium]|nr:flippase-like domain-containing protein [Chloroflexota bacterium]